MTKDNWGAALAVFPEVNVGTKTNPSVEPELFYVMDTNSNGGWRASIYSWTLMPDNRLMGCYSVSFARRAIVRVLNKCFVFESGAILQVAQSYQDGARRWMGSLGFQASAGYRWHEYELSLIYRGNYFHRLDSAGDRMGICFSFMLF
ncbi:MAG: hypothetical protein V2A61_03970 [Calditrichota bacterium]